MNCGHSATIQARTFCRRRQLVRIFGFDPERFVRQYMWQELWSKELFDLGGAKSEERKRVWVGSLELLT